MDGLHLKPILLVQKFFLHLALHKAIINCQSIIQEALFLLRGYLIHRSLNSVNGFLKVNCRLLIITDLVLNIGYIIIAHSSSFTIGRLLFQEHIASFSQINDSQSIWLTHKIIVFKPLGFYQRSEYFIQLTNFQRRLRSYFELAFHSFVLDISHSNV